MAHSKHVAEPFRSILNAFAPHVQPMGAIKQENDMSKLAHSNQETMDGIERNERDAPSRPEPPDPLDQQYCCFDCSAKFRIGEAIAADVMRCPTCCSANMHPIGMEPEQLTEYHGPIGTKN